MEDATYIPIHAQQLIVAATKQLLNGEITDDELGMKVLNILLGAGVIGGA